MVSLVCEIIQVTPTRSACLQSVRTLNTFLNATDIHYNPLIIKTSLLKTFLEIHNTDIKQPNE